MLTSGLEAKLRDKIGNPIQKTITWLGKKYGSPTIISPPDSNNTHYTFRLQQTYVSPLMAIVYGPTDSFDSGGTLNAYRTEYRFELILVVDITDILKAFEYRIRVNG